LFFLLIPLISLFSSCFFESDSGGTGTIIIGSASSKAVVDATESLTLNYKITLIGPVGTINKDVDSLAGVKINVAPGKWDITLKAYGKKNGDPIYTGPDVLRGIGTKSVSVAVGKTIQAVIHMVTATEIVWTALTAWTELREAAQGTATPVGREEIIYLKGSGAANIAITSGTNDIVIQRKVTIIVEEGDEWEIERTAGIGDSFFAVNAGGSLTIEGKLILDGNKVGYISGTNEPLIQVTGGSLILDGPTLRNNKLSTGSGGGVDVLSGAFTMKDGAISGNTADLGGGVCLGGSSAFTMSGGSITGNEATGSSGGGGGVYFVGTTFTMTGGTIGGAGAAKNTTADNGGGVYFAGSSAFTMSGGSITGNEATTESGGGVYISAGGFTMKGSAAITDNEAGYKGGGVFFGGGDFDMEGSAKVNGNHAGGSGGGVYVITGDFTMQDSAAITGNTSDTAGGGVVVDNFGTFTIKGGKIGGNIAGANGGGVYIANYGTAEFIMEGGIVYGNAEATTNSNTAVTGASLHKDASGVAVWGSGVYHTGGASTLTSATTDATTDIVGIAGLVQGNTNDTLKAW
jgi:hypothetical protein